MKESDASFSDVPTGGFEGASRADQRRGFKVEANKPDEPEMPPWFIDDHRAGFLTRPTGEER